jgi:hypothetical protein
MDKDRTHSDSECYTPLLEPIRFYVTSSIQYVSFVVTPVKYVVYAVSGA